MSSLFTPLEFWEHYYGTFGFAAITHVSCHLVILEGIIIIIIIMTITIIITIIILTRKLKESENVCQVNFMGSRDSGHDSFPEIL